jgi:alpha-beta hydrolase superfamily lysophospholipase
MLSGAARSGILAILMLGLAVSSHAAEMPVATGGIEGSLLLPEGADQLPVALLIAGSGPTDRDGNGPIARPGTLRKLAEQLAARGIATFRYDKRGVGPWRPSFGKPEDFRFAHFVDDAVALVAYLKGLQRFQKVFVVGHREGGLVTILTAARTRLDGIALLATTSRRQGDLLKEQLAKQIAPGMLAPIASAIDRMMAGAIVDPLPPGINIPPNMQPAFASAFREDPLPPLKSLKLPILIAAAGRDQQVSRVDFDQLLEAAASPQTVWLDTMNHVLVDVGDDADNIAAYNQPERPLNSELIEVLTRFIRTN